MNTIGTKALFVALLSCLVAGTAMAQEQLKGYVTDMDGKPIPAASVYVADSFDSTVSDSLGIFSLKTRATFPIRLVASHKDFMRDTISVQRGRVEDIRFRLRKVSTYKLSEVVVSVSSLGVGEGEGRTTLKPMDVYTNPSGNGDLSMALRQTPGLQDVGDKEGFFVRGGDSRESIVTIEGIRIRGFFGKNSPYAAARSRFETGMFRGLSLSTGGYGATEGGALSGLLSLRLAGKSPSSISIGLSPLFMNVGLGTLSRSKQFYLEQNASYSDARYIRLFLKPEYQLPGTNNALAYNARTVWSPTPQDEVKGLLLLLHDRSMVSLAAPTATGSRSLYTGRNSYGFGMAHWRHTYEDGRNSLTLSAGYSMDDNILWTEEERNRNELKSRETDLQVRARLDTHIGASQWKIGLDYNYLTTRLRLSHITGGEVPSLYDHLPAAYAEAFVPLLGKMSVTAGLRAEYSHATRRSMLLPRLSVSYRLADDQTVTIDGGRYASTGEYYLEYGILPRGWEESYQYNATYEWRLTQQHILRVQLYDKEYRNLALLDKLPDVSYSGKGYARGIDLFWKATGILPSFEHWLSYSYTDASREHLQYIGSETPHYVARHTISSVMKYWCAPIGSLINVSLSYRTGMSYHNPNLSPDRYLNGSLPAHFNMSASYNYPFKTGKSSGVFVVSVHNLFNSNPTYGYRFAQEKVGDSYPSVRISSPYRQFIMVGLFINIGVDRRNEILNTNLKINSR